ncbi:ABC transporter substrate-binding protein [Vallicoccus soli]|uniref:ABC transporter substrate-binding protein n=1 Tax=Vallicoccus soli TaxID=2339232 RepID=A0A3A3Z6N6_9ACTN|nr:ABC transporter substrate-binding protein [Vallicoccus soli]RJK96365.1 ABC transporter substrate-binding protein [Vallicoccus soli]
MRTTRRALPAALAAGALLLAGCGGDGPPSTAAAPPAERCIGDFDPAADYVPDTGGVQDAEGFTLSDERSYQVLTVEQPYPGGSPESYVLVRCGAPDPELTGDLADAPRIEVPVRSLYSASTTHLPMLEEVGALGVLTGVADGGLVTSPAVNERLEAGTTTAYAAGGTVDTESVVAADPDVLVTGGYDDAAYPVLREAGVPVLADSEWLEPTPLGRAEWVKVFGALTGRQEEAAQAYERVKDAYEGTRALAEGAEPVEVLPGSTYEGTWYVPGGGSYLSRLLADAGGTTAWADDPSTGSLPVPLEEVVAEAGDAPVWLVTDDWATTADALAADPRYAELAALRDGGLWTSAKVVGPGGGSDFYERGVARPDLVLADLVHVLHPELLPEHGTTFYRPVPQG